MLQTKLESLKTIRLQGWSFGWMLWINFGDSQNNAKQTNYGFLASQPILSDYEWSPMLWHALIDCAIFSVEDKGTLWLAARLDNLGKAKRARRNLLCRLHSWALFYRRTDSTSEQKRLCELIKVLPFGFVSLRRGPAAPACRISI